MFRFFSSSFNSQQLALISLFLFVPASSIGVTMSLFIAPGVLGNGIFTLAKIWIVILPLFWTWKFNRHALKLPKLKTNEIMIGTLLGIAMFTIILTAYYLWGKPVIEITAIRSKAAAVGITSLKVYLAGLLYWSLINSAIEEFIWRGFTYSQCAILMRDNLAILVSAILFTLHHIIAIYGYTHNLLVVILGSLGVCFAGAIWSWLYRTYRSIMPGYISHIWADIAIGLVGWDLLFS